MTSARCKVQSAISFVPRSRFQVPWLTLIVLSIFHFPFSISAAADINLDSCVVKAYRHFSFQRQVEIAEEITNTGLSRIDKQYLPSLELNAMSTYQNTQISIPVAFNIPGFTPPTVPLNLNSALLTLRQWIYDGSATHYAAEVERASGNVAQLEVETQKLDVRTNVMQRFFAVLLSDKQLANLDVRIKTLTERITEMNVGVTNNVVLAADRDLLLAEVVRIKAMQTETRFLRREQLAALSELIGETLPDNAQLITPNAQLDASVSTDNRPDVKLLNGQIDLLEARKGPFASAYLPRIGVFADLGIGYPGYDIFDASVAPMARVGISLNWKIWDWQQGGLQQQTLELNKSLVLLQRDRIRTQANVMSATFKNNIAKADELLLTDEQLINLYNSVTGVYASKMNNGAITAAQYVEQLNKQEEAKVNKELHSLQRLIAVMNYNTNLGR